MLILTMEPDAIVVLCHEETGSIIGVLHADESRRTMCGFRFLPEIGIYRKKIFRFKYPDRIVELEEFLK